MAAVDLDGDGIDEEVKYAASSSGTSFLSIARVGEDRHYSLWTKNFFHSAGLAGLVDVKGDSVPELVWWEQLDAGCFRIYLSQIAIDSAAARDSTLAEFDWSLEGKLLPDGRWGGTVLLCGALDSDNDGVNDLVALGFNTGIMEEPRTVCFWDLGTGEMVQSVPTGATPTGGSAIADINDDGSDELVLGLEAPGNGVSAGDWDDSHSYVVAFESDGSVLWWRELGVYSSNVELVVDDLDGDGTSEVVTIVGGHSEQDIDTFGLSIWRGHDGAQLAEARFGCSVNAVETLSSEVGTRVFTGSSDGFVRRLCWDGDKLSIEAELDCLDAVECVRAIRLEPAPTPPRLVVGTVKGGLAVLDENLVPRAFGDVGEIVSHLRPTMVTVDGRVTHGVLVLAQSRVFRLHLTRRPLPAWMKSGLPAVMVLLALGLFPLTRRTAVAWLRRWLLPGRTRGVVLDSLLDSLTVVGHGKLAATSTLRRLREQLRMLQYHEGPPPEAFRQRFKQAVGDVGDICLPGIREIVEEAERLGLVVAQTATLRTSLEKLTRILEERLGAGLSRVDAAALGARLDSLLPNTEESLLAIRRAAESERSSDLGAELNRALNSSAAESRRLDAEVVVKGCEQLAGIRVLGTASELSFVLENLLANALGAVRDQRVRGVSLSVTVDSAYVVVRVADTGKGIAVEDHTRVFMTGFSDKTSGGHGLPLSREILSRRGGSIDLIESSPGNGAVLEVRFAICRS
ncbi:MAG: HAMP domain-containing sensor histidine kinase [Candidatus Eisenbacteria bacterium]